MLNNLYDPFLDMGNFTTGNSQMSPYTQMGNGWNLNADGMNGLGGINEPGFMDTWGKSIFDGLGKLGSIYMGMQNYGLAKKSMNQQREAFEKNYAAQRQLTNSQMEDRQRARVASNPTGYESVDSYMAKNAVR
jgi:hypothetical protein